MQPLRPNDPTQVGPYRLMGRLGAGGMGEVFYGRSPGGREVAVKLIHRRHAESESFRKRFAREIEAARLVGGFYTAQVVDADTEADPPWMVTDYIPGPSLRVKVADEGPLGVEEVRALGAGLAEGLAAIHSHDLVHRDLKPSNVLMAEGGPRIIDFGIARALDASTMTSTGAFVGTYAYASPEQVNERPIGPASDVFSLGSVLTFAAIGRPPFVAEAPLAIARKIAGEPPDLRGIETDLRDLIAECLEKNPARRPHVTDLLQRLAVPPTTPDESRPRPITTVRPPDTAATSGVITPDHGLAGPRPEQPLRRATPDEPAAASPPIAPAADRAVAGRPVRDRKWGRVVGVALGVPLVLGLLVGAFAYFMPLTFDPPYQSGDKPRSVTHDKPSGCIQVPCPPRTELDAYQWTLSAGSAFTTTFTTKDISPQYIRGRLRLLPGNCHGTQVRWALGIEKAPFIFDDLSEQDVWHTLNQRAPKNTSFIITAHRTDRQPCTAVLSWDGPRLREPPLSER